MIIGQSTTTEIIGIETMFVAGQLVGGSGIVDLVVQIDYSELTIEQKSIYDQALDLVSDSNYNMILNTTAELEISRITSTVLTEGTSTEDFESLSEVDKDKFRALLGLFIELNTA